MLQEGGDTGAWMQKLGTSFGWQVPPWLGGICRVISKLGGSFRMLSN
jgi:hypothetical protein